MAKTFLLLFLSILALGAIAQLNKVDSLKKILDNQREDTNKVIVLNELARNVYDNKLKRQYSELAKNLSRKLGYLKGEAKALMNQGGAEMNSENYFDAYNYFDSSIQVFKLIDDKPGEAAALSNISMALHRDPVKALDYALQALKIKEEIRDTIGTINCLYLIGILKSFIPEPPSSVIPYLQRMANLASTYTEAGNNSLLAYALAGDIYEESGKLDSALYYYKEVEKESADIEDSIRTSSSLGSTYLRMRNYQDANRYYNQLYECAKRRGNEYRISEALVNLGKICLENGNYQTAFKYYKSAEKLIPKQEDEVYRGLILINEKTGNFREAYMYQKKLQVYLDTAYSDKLKAKLIPVQLNFNIRKKQDSALLVKNKALSELQISQVKYKNSVRTYLFLAGIIVFVLISGLLFRNNRSKQKANTLLNQQKEELNRTLHELKSTQNQLVQSEKMASLGELTAGIAHEIQNPLNFVNNFSEVSNELIDEMHVEIDKGNTVEAKQIAYDLKQNLEKINHHGKRADSIVKGMLQHSRASTGKKELIDVNALTAEYLNLAYHGMRAKDKLFSVNTKTEFDEKIKSINIVPQDMGRAILNLINNAFYAVTEKKKLNGQDYEPSVIVSTRQNKNSVEIKVSDNGNGIPSNIVNKIFQPFFTTKPTGQGTGLGLSLSYDIITKEHGGELKVETKEGMGSEFTIKLPDSVPSRSA